MPYGMAGHVGLGKETAWGTAVAVTDYVEALSESLTLAIERYDVKNIVAKLSEPLDQAGLRRVEGEVAFWGHPVSAGHFLNAAFGQGSRDITVVLSGYLFTTSWMPTPTDASTLAPVPSYTLEVFRDVTSANRYAGAVVNRLQANVAPNQDLRFTASMLAKTTSVVAKTTATFPGSPTAPFAFDQASIEIGGAATDRIEALTFTLIDNQLEGVPVLNNSTEIAKIRRRGPQLVRLSGVLGFEDLTDYQRFVDQTTFALRATFFRASSFQLVVECPQVVYSTFPVTLGRRERITIGWDGLAQVHAGSGTAVKVALTTVKSNY